MSLLRCSRILSTKPLRLAARSSVAKPMLFTRAFSTAKPTMAPLYTTSSTALGGRKDGVVKTDDGKLEFKLSLPKSMGGDEKNTNPEQLFSAGYASCFHGALAFESLQKYKKPLPANTTVQALVSLEKVPDGLKLSVELRVTLPGLPRAEAEELTKHAHALCPYSRATANNIAHKLTVV